MARRIWKFEVPVQDHPITLELPHGAKIVKVGNPTNYPLIQVTFWAEFEEFTRGLPEERSFRVFGTGHEIPSEGYEYVDTAFAGSLVWHLYEKV